MYVIGCAGSSTASLAWKRWEVPFWESQPRPSAFLSRKPSWLSVNADAELLQQGDWIQGCCEAHESTETHQGNPRLPFLWQQLSYFVIIWMGTCLIWLIFFFFFLKKNPNNSVFICEIWGSFCCGSCLLLNACNICLWPMARLYVCEQLQRCEGTATRRQCFGSLLLCLSRQCYSFRG